MEFRGEFRSVVHGVVKRCDLKGGGRNVLCFDANINSDIKTMMKKLILIVVSINPSNINF